MLALARALPVFVCVLALLTARPSRSPAPVAAGVVHLVVRDVPTGPPNAIQWLVVSPRDPRTLYVGRYACPMVFLRSRDAGRTWRNLLDAAQICVTGDQGPGAGGNTLTGPLQIAGDGRTLFLDEEYNEGSADYLSYFVLSSADGGDRWSIPDHGEDYGSGMLYMALGPPSRQPHGPQFGYVTDYRAFPPNAGYSVSYGDFTGHSSSGGEAGAGADPGGVAGAPGSCCFNAPVPDARDPTVVYVNLQVAPQSFANDQYMPVGAVRSEHGRPWAVVARPRTRPPLRTFSVTTAPHEAGLLVGRTQDKGVPPDRVYLSADHGRTWRAAACPGVLRGACHRAPAALRPAAGPLARHRGGHGWEPPRRPAVPDPQRAGGRGRHRLLPHAGRGADVAARRRPHPAPAVGNAVTA